MKTLLIWLFLTATLLAQPTWDRIDRHALAAPPAVETEVRPLVRYLVQQAHGEEERARAIFRWITDRIAYDVPAFMNRSHPDGDPRVTLQRRMAVCDGYSKLYQAMAQEAGLQSAIVLGQCKGYGFDPGAPTNTPQLHSWNAVMLQGRWQLLDCTWGSGGVTVDGSYKKRFNDFFFLTPPDRFMCDHFPNETRWQLISPPWTKAQFDQQVRVTAYFFLYGMGLESHRNLWIDSSSPFTVRVQGRPELEANAMLYQGNQQVAPGSTFVTKTAGRFRIDVSPPARGEYILRLFAKPMTNLQDRRTLDQVAEYRLTVRHEPRFVPFPRAYGTYVATQAELLSPMGGVLPAGRAQTFSLRAPGASDVRAALGNGSYVQLQKDGDRFTGSVTPLAGKLIVYARYGTDPRYNGLVEYDVR